jgi:hypothetical protein
MAIEQTFENNAGRANEDARRWYESRILRACRVTGTHPTRNTKNAEGSISAPCRALRLACVRRCAAGYPSLRAETYGDAQKAVQQQPAALTIPSDPDDAFVALREAARKNDADRAAAISATLVDYPIPSYVEYFRIKSQMFDRAASR